MMKAEFKETIDKLIKLGPGTYKMSDYPYIVSARVRLELSKQGLTVDLEYPPKPEFELKVISKL